MCIRPPETLRKFDDTYFIISAVCPNVKGRQGIGETSPPTPSLLALTPGPLLAKERGEDYSDAIQLTGESDGGFFFGKRARAFYVETGSGLGAPGGEASAA